jgi:RNA polymerase sigma-70 factor, ECF subfamily
VLYAMALREVRDPVLAEDLVQETFVAALGSAGARFGGRSSVRTWLTGILKHKIIDALRERAKAPSSFDDTVQWEDTDDDGIDGDQRASAFAGDRHGVDGGPLAAITHKRFLEACEAQLGRMSRQGASAFMLTDVLGYESSEVCEMLGVTSGNLYTMLHRTRRNLRGALESHRPN